MVPNIDSALAFFNLGPMEIGMVLVVALLLFGKRLPEVARSMGKSITEFKKGLNEAQQEMQSEIQKETPRGGAEAPQSPAEKS